MTVKYTFIYPYINTLRNVFVRSYTMSVRRSYLKLICFTEPQYTSRLVTGQKYYAMTV